MDSKRYLAIKIIDANRERAHFARLPEDLSHCSDKRLFEAMGWAGYTWHKAAECWMYQQRLFEAAERK